MRAMVVAAVVIALAAASPVLAETVACHLTYGGETQVIESAPLASPYAGTPTAIGSFFLFRIIFVREPADLARINLYVYAHAEFGEAPTPVQHASYPYPVSNHGRYGFTGLQRVYEPKHESELQYWCEMRGA
ncbi:hypothetical protein LZ012_08640 [Dechloromonas sp. XY25]|uniref:Uncharacterized protein n=1 Tax=Dechloromonas hankyongensis TaxID=2908002 RepID=A0ABS9K1K9_9RHOO|nr:hypothetical protein [Dechloromonas hankyongensis]MCG2577063.1 hypothetical protein [Dechloromonas hankyongensis]